MRKNENVLKGYLVKSAKGYDKGKHYIVKDINNGFALLINGKSKPYSNPKKKNLKHLFSLGFKYEINDTFKEERINLEIYNLIKNYEKSV